MRIVRDSTSKEGEGEKKKNKTLLESVHISKGTDG